MDYKTSGVDIQKGRSFVEYIKVLAPSIGGFNGMMEIPSGYEKPVLVSGADGVGTKINICRIANDYTTIGQDLVAMCVNDVICSGAKPLYFLDYISAKTLDGNVSDIVYGVAKACELTGMELLGGETAEHFRQSDYDLAGFCTGIVEKNDVVDGRNIRPGDVVIGIESSGLHSNGYTLVNDMLWRNYIYYKEMPELLVPTTIYAPLVQHLLDEVPILGMAHITGGGLPENLPRCLPEGLKVNVNYGWDIPEVFEKIQNAGDISDTEMLNVFNMGIGFCLVVPPEVVDLTQTLIADTPHGMRSWVIGEVDKA
ncbi:phosphoribosylaminoimidazole synthetase [Synechococcus phage ACG-2014d]|jgi:phosphoribosylformylglycinamidine cyclo-ligase|uniref:phosphoribosylformylglycinamidine cyclo-ligase n=1 Tax=Synechococcus phage ACG-2014d TaxID=1493509 RepID=A0A0E3HPW9_9CAUD|nr:phosphoribosylaminoimidazole synthetase [Synechococcus phage ACG-2014d]YP_010355365.1 phosphoribosylaminoimidazole synthetase [Synechococcus phage ACG-2014d]AIX14807.1 phosphoribosylaminoimidazole synthetase [Synechococcus phage ACG-2014d]AIX15024.1 phosphoribosylaminoimidazole synthetase [Synechococcus phage ACG-2014d]AIX15451.1 phosphoribosylaminoimidazole synthetase [Synechococcus phage ACG-2014d]AIX16100.1 phosphoribosylaminoimidazole synthetase [Synechococcus phage ACG-2014d]AIX18997.